LGAGLWGHASAREGSPGVRRGGPRSAAERPDRREEKTEEARGRGKKRLTGGTDLAERERKSGREWLLT
jgi:hypothetical protein